jgi:ATP-binding cassette subfamily B (MDR/TAP) protein 1
MAAEENDPAKAPPAAVVGAGTVTDAHAVAGGGGDVGVDGTTSNTPTIAPEAAQKTGEKTPADVKLKPGEGDDGAKEETGPPEKEAGFGDYARVFGYATKWDIVAYVVGGLASIGAGTTLPLMNVVFANFVQDFTDFDANGLQNFTSSLNRLALYMFILFLARFALNILNKFAFRMIGIRLSSAIRLHYLKCLFGQSIHVLDSMQPGAAASTITSTANVLQLGISEKLGTLLEWLSTMVTSIIVAFVWSWELTLVSSTVVVFLIIVVTINMPFILKRFNAQAKADTKSSAVATEALNAIRMVMASGAERRVMDRFVPHALESKKQGRAMAPLSGLQFGLIFFGIYAMFTLTFWYGIKAYTEGRIGGIGSIVACLMSVMLIVVALERIATPIMAINKAIVAAASFFTVIDAPQPKFGDLKDPDVTATQDIVLKNVVFAYPSRPHVQVLDGLDLTIEAGKVTAIVGPSGSGKSTIVGLVERWYNLQQQHVIATAVEAKPPKKKGEEGKGKEEDEEIMETPFDQNKTPVQLSGSVETCGHSLDEIDLKWWRSQIGLVQQEPVLFNTTIFENIANGLVGSQWENESEERKLELVKEASKEAFADEFIDRLPDGYNTLVGDVGAKLSGGQRQRIAIARSIVRKPRILILDEATSAIDVRGERIVQAALDRVSEGRTTITIAHRLSTIRKADRIVVVKKGRIVEQGTHDTLLNMDGGVYQGLMLAQQLSLGDGPLSGDGDEDEIKEEELAAAITKENAATQAGEAAESDDATTDKKKEKDQDRGFFKSFGALLVEQKDQWPLYGLTIFFGAYTGANVAIMAWLFSQIINIFTIPESQLRSEANFWSLMWLVFAIAIGIGYFFLLYVSTNMAQSICYAYRVEYFNNILFQKPEYFDREENSRGTLTSRLSGDPKRLEELLGPPMAFSVQACFSVIGALVIAFAFSWKLALLGFLVAMPINTVAVYWRWKYEIEFEKMNNAVFEESSKFAAEAIGAARTVSALTLEGPITDRYDKLLAGHTKEAFKKARWRTPVLSISDSIGLACQALVLWYGGRLLLNGEVGALSFFVCYMAVTQGSEAAGQGFSVGPNAAQVTAAANRLIDVRESRNREPISEDEAIPDVDGGMKIEFQDVDFTYPTRSTPVIRGLNISIEKGQFAALVGASGSGKTSIISLLERFYEPNQGRIVCNGKDISEINVYAWRKYLSLVAQEASLLRGTIRENILLGVDPALVTDAQMHQACRDASIHDFIVSLPEGYATNIGSGGVSLSGGQRQRIAIARALVRDPKILLLDEATSSLDAESEKLVQAAFERAGKGRTMVVVAHRLATVQRADVIFVLGEGGLLEKGSHAELLQKRGVYWNMCQGQALDR